MRTDEIRRRSRWMIRAQEWDEPRARYPNVWQDEMPRHILAYDTVASRIRLGDLVAVYYPASQKHPDRSERFLGLSRVVGLRQSHDPSCAWIDLEVVHRFTPPLDLGEAPRRVFLCCDPGWSEHEVEMFRKVFAAAVAAGWKPTPEETEEGAPPRVGRTEETREASETKPDETAVPEDVPPISPGEETALYGGAVMNGDMRDPRDGTWLALLAQREDRLVLVRLEATGRGGLHGHLRDPDAELMRAAAIGLGFPFGLPVSFAETLLEGPFPDKGWWALAGKLEKMSRPDFLVALQEFRDSKGEVMRYTDELAGAPSPLHRSGPDIGSMAYHGIKLIAEERSRYAMRPFEQAQGKALIEVFPEGALQRLVGASGNGRPETIEALAGTSDLPVDIPRTFRSYCEANVEALGAVVAARCAAMAVASGEIEKTPEELAEGEAERVRHEGWIYGRSC